MSHYFFKYFLLPPHLLITNFLMGLKLYVLLKSLIFSYQSQRLCLFSDFFSYYVFTFTNLFLHCLICCYGYPGYFVSHILYFSLNVPFILFCLYFPFPYLIWQAPLVTNVKMITNHGEMLPKINLVIPKVTVQWKLKSHLMNIQGEPDLSISHETIGHINNKRKISVDQQA